MQKLNGQFFTMPNTVFAHHLTPDQLTHLVGVSGRAANAH